MQDVGPILAENGTAVEPGGVYLTFSGEPDQPYKVAKVISVNGGPGGAALDQQLAPDLTPMPSPDVWLKLFLCDHSEPPALSVALAGDYRIIPVSANMFLAWGPPKFPIRIGTEAVTEAEMSARTPDWYKRT